MVYCTKKPGFITVSQIAANFGCKMNTNITKIRLNTFPRSNFKDILAMPIVDYVFRIWGRKVEPFIKSLSKKVC